MDWCDSVQKLKPRDQVTLTEDELNESIIKVLTTNNPHAPQNIVRFNFKKGEYENVGVNHTAVLFEMESSTESEEYRRLMIKEGLIKENAATSAGVESYKAVKDGVERSVAYKADKNKIKRKNEAGFIDQTTQTLNFTKEINCMSEPPPCRTFSAIANQWKIYDAYQHELQKQEKQEATVKEENESCYPAAVAEATKILEQIVHQKVFDDIVQDFKYFDDEADRFRGQEGILLPLWRFQYKKARGFSVTALCWSSKYPELFAVGLGSHDSNKQEGGMIIFHSLKNSFFPEHISTTSGVQCLDIHPQHPSLLAVGFYDGCVAVYNDLKPVCEGTFPQTSSIAHPVFKVCWQNDDVDNNHRFLSVDTDFLVLSWTQIKHKLFSTEMIKLSLTDDPSGGGTSLDFHKQIDHVILVGTEQGKIHKCSKCHSDKFLMTYNSHNSEVCTVEWNHFHPRVFISCSFDKTVKIWDDTIKDPVFTFELRSRVKDVAWAPYSSTVFAAVTVNGIVHVFDLSINKDEAICQQLVVAKEKAKLTRIQFNPVNPVIIVGNDQGVVNSFKLSPNLRKMSKAQGPQSEVDKMEKCLKA